jgi:hypothetical protein
MRCGRGQRPEVRTKDENTGDMNTLTMFGLLAVSLMLIFYALESRHPWFTLAFAASCLLGSAYGFLQGAWPFGIVELVWSAVAVRKWMLEAKRTES